MHPAGEWPTDINCLVEALQYVKSLDGTPDQVDIINISMSGEVLVDGLSEILNDLANSKVIVSSAGMLGILQ